MKVLGWWGEWNIKEIVLGDLRLFVIRVGIELDSLLYNFFDYKNLKVGIVGICMRINIIIFNCEYIVWD